MSMTGKVYTELILKALEEICRRPQDFPNGFSEKDVKDLIKVTLDLRDIQPRLNAFCELGYLKSPEEQKYYSTKINWIDEERSILVRKIHEQIKKQKIINKIIIKEKGDVKDTTPYQFIKEEYDFNIFDDMGEHAYIRTTSLLRVKNKIKEIGGSGWTCFPHNLKVSLRYENNQKTTDYFEVPHSDPEKKGSDYLWNTYYDPPLGNGQLVRIKKEFEVLHIFISKREYVCYHSNRELEEFAGMIHLPSNRPAKRWWIYADYLPNKHDNYILSECNEETNEIKWSIKNLCKGAIYYINWDW